MKRHGHLFVGILDFDNLVLAARKAQRGKHYRDNVLDFNQDPPSSCMSCHQGFNARGRDFVGMLGGFR